MKKLVNILIVVGFPLFLSNCDIERNDREFFTLSKSVLEDKIRGAWAMQTIGVTYGGPTEFRYLKRIIPDSVEIVWTDTTLAHLMKNWPGLYDDIYMDLTFVEVLDKVGLDAPASAHGEAYAKAKYWLWHANQQGRYNILHGIEPPASGHWMNNPHADDIDFQIEADFAGIMNPGMPNSALEICDKVGHIMNYGDGYYGGVLVAGMYTYAFIEDDIPTIVNKALAMIPGQSTFYQCIADVVEWHKEYPGDWKQTWQLIEDNWGLDIGCPDGAFSDFNIDAKINAAYVVLGLLYGEGDISMTMEVATRAGQDSDCNPATAGAILGTVKGYDQIPEFWGKGLRDIEDMDFKFTTMSLNDAYEISYKHALEMIIRNGGEIVGEDVKIKIQEAVVAPLEQSFPGYKLGELVKLNKKITFSDAQELELEFEGVGVVLRGRVRHTDFDDIYALTTNEQTLENYQLKVNITIDNASPVIMDLPISFIERAHEIFYKYELPNGRHKMIIRVTNPHEKIYLQMLDFFTYQPI